jgi:hypothetical protein
MNIRVLDKIEIAWIKYDWKEVINRVSFSNDEIDTLIGMIDNFKSNRGAKELALFKYRQLPVYATIVKSEYGELLDWLYSTCIDKEMYEHCKRIIELKKRL